MSKFDDKIRKRWERFETRAKEYTQLDSIGDFTIITNRGYKGVSKGDDIIVPPIYNDIFINPSFNMAAVGIDGLLAILDLNSGELLSDFDYDKLEFSSSDHSIILYKDGLKGLFDLSSRVVVHEACYSDINLTAADRFSWVYNPEDGYYMVDNYSGKKIYIGNDIDECFDENYGHIFVYKNNRITMLTENGTDDIRGYRELLASLGGRISLYNSSRHISVVADIYGFIL